MTNFRSLIRAAKPSNDSRFFVADALNLLSRIIYTKSH